jgi:tRNA(Ile)-lysidine synthase
VASEVVVLAAVRPFLAGRPAGPGVAAISGGADSVALLRALHAAGAAPLVAHLNHQLRGADSDADEAFVRALATGLGLPVRCERLDVRGQAAGANLEAAARRLRYDWLAAVARDIGAAWVATGHTADDQAETVLHHLLRGTGLRGLAGMPPARELAPGVLLVRPLLTVRRAEVLAYLADLGQPFRQDASNDDRGYTRNRLRHELLPQLAADYNPAVAEVLARLAAQSAEVQAHLDAEAALLLADAELPRAGAMVVLDAPRLASAPELLVREALRQLWQRERWPLGEMGYEAWQRAAAVVSGEQAAVDCPGGVRLRRLGRVVQASNKQAACGLASGEC